MPLKRNNEPWGSPVEIETRRRIKLSLWAYSYEFENSNIVNDSIFDFESYMVDLRINTRRPDLDRWFRVQFEPATGMWIRRHPELDKIKQLYKRVYQ